MARDVKAHYEAFPDPSPSVLPVTQGPLEQMDDALHFAWAWHRYKYTFRKSEGIRILDAGCGTGVTTLSLAQLNPGSTVLGVDFSPKSLEIARSRAEAAGSTVVCFDEHNLEQALPESLGKYDFIVARMVLGNGGDNAAILTNLKAALAPDGLLLATLPSATGRLAVRQMQRAVEAIVGPDADTATRVEAGLELLQTLRNDHPIRRYDAARHGVEPPTREQFAATYFNDADQTGTYEDVTRLIEGAGLRVLLVHDRGAWRPERVFLPSLPPAFMERIGKLPESNLAMLRDALDINLHPDSYFVYACQTDFEPHIPAWPDDLEHGDFESLVPHYTNLGAPAKLAADPALRRGYVTYRAVNGALGELDFKSHQAFLRVDGKKTIGEIEAELKDTPLGDDNRQMKVGRWLGMTNRAYLLLEAPNPRENVDCTHLGAIKDRLDCACPRRWVRACEIHGVCTISTLKADDPKAETLHLALGKLGKNEAMACDHCPDYVAEE